MNITIVHDSYDKIKQIDNIKKDNITFNIIDLTTFKGRKEGRSIMSYWGARLNPFILVKDNETPVTAFYSEDKKNPIEELIKYLNA